jgi:hypothetical protein
VYLRTSSERGEGFGFNTASCPCVPRWASVANYFATKEGLDAVAQPLTAPTPVPSAAPAATGDPYGFNAYGAALAQQGRVQAYEDALAQQRASLTRYDSQLAQVHDRAWLYEAIIVTIAGVAWFALRARQARS